MNGLILCGLVVLLIAVVGMMYLLSRVMAEYVARTESAVLSAVPATKPMRFEDCGDSAHVPFVGTSPKVEAALAILRRSRATASGRIDSYYARITKRSSNGRPVRATYTNADGKERQARVAGIVGGSLVLRARRARKDSPVFHRRLVVAL